MQHFYYHNYPCLGDGKTYHVANKLDYSENLTVAINEDFSPGKIINKLQSLTCINDSVGIFFNFTILPPEVNITFFILLLMYKMMQIYCHY